MFCTVVFCRKSPIVGQAGNANSTVASTRRKWNLKHTQKKEYMNHAEVGALKVSHSNTLNSPRGSCFMGPFHAILKFDKPCETFLQSFENM